MILRAITLILGLVALWFILAAVGLEYRINIAVVTCAGVIVVLSDWLTPPTEDIGREAYKFKNVDTDDTKHIILWDRSSIDLPSLSYLQRFKFESIYFCTTTGASPDLSLIKPASRVERVNHWEYRTDNDTHLKIYLILALYHVYLEHGSKTELHIFTKDPDLKTRFKLHCSAYEFKAVHFISDQGLA